MNSEEMNHKMSQMEWFQRLLQDDDFKTFIQNPKVQQAFLDPEFQTLVQEKKMGQLMTHPKFAPLMSDPELVKMMLKLKSHFFEK